MEKAHLTHAESFKFKDLKYDPSQDYKSVYIWGIQSNSDRLDAIYIGQSKYTRQRHLKHLSHLLMGDYWVIDAKNSDQYYSYIKKMQDCNSIEEFRDKVDTYSSNYASPPGSKDCGLILNREEMNKRLNYISNITVHTFKTTNETEEKDKMIETYLIELFSKYLILKYKLNKNKPYGDRRLTFNKNISKSNHTILGAVNRNQSLEIDTDELTKFFNI